MKALTLIAFLTGLSLTVSSQEVIELASTKFESPEDYQKGEIIVKKCSDILFSLPINSDEGERILATRVIYDWIQGTPDYHFLIEDWITKINDKDPHLMGLYLAGIATFVLDNKDKKDNNELIQLQTAERIIKYIKIKDNKVQKTRQIKKMISAYDIGELSKFLDLHVE